MPEAYRGKTVRCGPNCSHATMANPAVKMPTMLTVGMEDQMVAYWVARSKANNPNQAKKYSEQVSGILQKFGGKILARGGKFQILEGPEKFHRFVVIEFPGLEKAVGCHESAEYAEAAAHRKKDGASELEIVIVEAI